MTDLSDLIARLEKAEGPDRRLDAMIECTLPSTIGPGSSKRMPHPVDECADGTYWHRIGGADSLWTAPDYTGSVDAALTLVPEGYEWQCGNDAENSKGWAVVDSVVWDEAFDEHAIRAIASTPALALCIAALRARGEG